ncbi:MAG: Hsp70 family protein [Deltaproteobacteria bacterium]|nr:Hsp70 family protein [Deltaproteobacteria bacterium]
MAKRLRVRLRARDVSGLAETIGPFLSANGAFLVTDERLAPPTPVVLQLCFEDGELALEGHGEVLGVRDREGGPRGLILGLSWSEATRPLVDRLLAWPRSGAQQVPAADSSEHPTGPLDPFADEAVTTFGEPLAQAAPSPWEAADELELDASPIPGPPPVPEPKLHFADATPEELARGFEDEASSSGDVAVGFEGGSPPPPDLILGFDDHPVSGPPARGFEAPTTLPGPGSSPPNGELGTTEFEASDLDEPLGFDEPPPIEADEPYEDVWSEDEEPEDPIKVVVGARVPIDDLVSDLLPAQPAPLMPPLPQPVATDPGAIELALGEDVRSRLRANTSTEYAFSADEVSSSGIDLAFATEANEVTPLARIELIRRFSPTVRTGDFTAPPLHSSLREGALPIPSKKQRPELRERAGATVAIDVGSSATRAACLTGAGGPRLLGLKGGSLSLPSVVAIAEEGNTWVGEAAVARWAQDPTHAVTRLRRLVACPHASPTLDARAAHLGPPLASAEEGEVAIRIGEHTISFEELTALLLQEAVRGAGKALGQPTNRVLLTCPAAYGQTQRVGLIVAGLLAGLHVEAVVSAPLAAIYERVVAGLRDGQYLLIDLGAGVVDVAVIEVREGMARALAVGGDLTLGGVDFDAALLGPQAYAAQPAARAANLLEAERAKLELDQQEVVTLQISGERHPRSITSEQARSAWLPILERISALVSEVLIRSGTNGPRLDGFFLLGGQARAPMVQQALAAAVGREPELWDGVELALCGAARLAAIADQGDPLPVVEVLSGTLGVGQSGGAVLPVIARDHPLPVGATYLHRVEADRDLNLYLFQGDRRRVDHDEPLAHLQLVESHDAPARPYAVAIDLNVEPSGPISARAFEANTRQEIELIDVPHLTRAQLLAHHGLSSGEGPGLISRWLKRLRGQATAE